MAINKKTDFEDTVQQQLDQSIDQLDAETLSKLNQARQTALSHAKKSNRMLSGWLTGLFASAALATLIITIVPKTPQTLPSLGNQQWDVMVMTDEEELDLYDELDFYQWLDDVHG